jgi:AcrR family transcriptional regulator
MEKMEKAYLEYVLEQGTDPSSVYMFCKKLKIEEASFYDKYASFEHLKAYIFKSYLADTVIAVQADAAYAQYSVREKLLAFMYTLVEKMKANRSFVLKMAEKFQQPIYIKNNAIFDMAEYTFTQYVNDLLIEARETKEIENRAIPQLMRQYPKVFWKETLYVIDFWLKDQSPLFEKTDTLIEKTINTTMDLMARSPLDAVLDLGKFLIQNRKMA